MNAKTFITILLAFVAAVLVSASVHADPYDGQQTIGTYYQYTNQIAYNAQPVPAQYNAEVVPAQYYDYVAPPRAGGWFGTGTEWLTGLRSPIYANVPPVHYTNFYTPVCGNACWFGGNQGYPRATATDFQPYRERIGGIFSY